MLSRSARNEVSTMAKHIKDIVIAALALTLICAIVVAALAGTNLLTRDTIAVIEQQATDTACKEVLEADSYTSLEGTWADGVLAVYEAKNGETLCGYVIKTSTVGKSSGLVLMTGITADGIVSGVTIIENNETAGYTDTVTKGGLLERLCGVADATDVDGVSQATKTSNGIKSGVNLALAVYEEVSTR